MLMNVARQVTLMRAFWFETWQISNLVFQSLKNDRACLTLLLATQISFPERQREESPISHFQGSIRYLSSSSGTVCNHIYQGSQPAGVVGFNLMFSHIHTTKSANESPAKFLCYRVCAQLQSCFIKECYWVSSTYICPSSTACNTTDIMSIKDGWR